MSKFLARLILFIFGEKRMSWFCKDFLDIEHPIVKTVLENFDMVEYEDYAELKQCSIIDESGHLVGLFKGSIKDTDIRVWLRLYCATVETNKNNPSKHRYFFVWSFGNKEIHDGLLEALHRSARSFPEEHVQKALNGMGSSLIAISQLDRIMSTSRKTSKGKYVSTSDK